MSYKGIPENQTGTVIKVITVSQEYINCKKDVDKFYWSIKKLIDSVKSVSKDVIFDGAEGQIMEKYKHCLKYTIAIALEDVDEAIDHYRVKNDEEVLLLRQIVANLYDDVEALFNQG